MAKNINDNEKEYYRCLNCGKNTAIITSDGFLCESCGKLSNELLENDPYYGEY